MEESKLQSGTILGCYRILEIADEKGEYCGKRLADMGAEVIKIENPLGNSTRSKGPFFHDQTGLETSLNFLHYNTNKRSITLDLEHRDGQELFKNLVKTADAIVESMPVGYLASLGLDYKSLLEFNPALIMTSISPFGQTGPHKDYRSSDIVNMAMGSFMQGCGEPDGMPLRPGGEQSYQIGAQCAALGTIAALHHKSITGKGQYVDVSIQESVLINSFEQAAPQIWAVHKNNVTRAGARAKWGFPYGLFPCRDGWTIIATVQASEWDRLAQWISEVTGDSEVLQEKYKGNLFDRAPHVEALTGYMLDFTQKLSKDELFLEGQKRKIPIMPVQSIEEVMNCPQLNGWGFFEQVKHPVAGALVDIGNPYHLGEGSLASWKAAPLLGEQNEQIYCSELGLDKDDLAILRSNGII